MPLRLPRAAAAVTSPFAASPRVTTSPAHRLRHYPWPRECLPVRCRGFHVSRQLCRSDVEAKNHYERLNIAPDASPAEIKKSFYTLSKAHHPDANPSDPTAAHTFSLLSESYTILSNPSRRASYDRDVLRLHQHHHQHHQHGAAPPHGSYHSTNPAGGRAPSGLSRRRGTFRGPPPSFYRNGGWGTHTEKRRAAHEESTNSSSSSSSTSSERADPWASAAFTHQGGMGPGSDPFHHKDEPVPHFDREGHTRTHQRQDERRRWHREKRAVGDDDIEFEPQTSLAGHFLIVAGILAATFLAPAIYLQLMRLGRQEKNRDS